MRSSTITKGDDLIYNKQLDSFIRAAELKSFSKAARELFITPTSLIQQINLLEKQLDITLFNRTTHGVTLTPAGESLYQDAKNLIRLSNNAIERARMIQGSISSEIRIGTSLLTKCRYLPDYWARAIEGNPDLEIYLVSQQNSEITNETPLAGLGKEYVMFEGLYLTEFYRNNCNFICFDDVPLCVAVSSKHRLYTKELIKPSDLYEETVLLLKPGISSHFDALREHLEKYPSIHIKDLDYYDISTFSSCELNNQIIITPAVWQDIHPSLKVIPLKPEITIPYGLIYSKHLCSKAYLLIESIKNMLNADN